MGSAMGFMRPIDRVHAVQKIVSSMKEMMSYDDVDIFFRTMKTPHPELDEDRGYSLPEIVRAHLAKCTDTQLLDIGSQLGLDVPEADARRLGDSKYWLIDHFRLFLSHVHTSKKSAANLKQSLQRYSISAFVAHEDIEPSDEWRDEILRSLMSMNSLAAILSDDFSASKWTDQEVGVAVARDVLVIPISKGVQPYGFIAKYQSVNSANLTVGEVAAKVYKTICANQKTRDEMVECLTSTVSSSPNIADAIFKVGLLADVTDVPTGNWEKVRENVRATATLRDSREFVDALNAALIKRGVSTMAVGSKELTKDLDEEIPF
jgi:hypothetical protein